MVSVFLRTGSSGHERSSESEKEAGTGKKYSIVQLRKTKDCYNNHGGKGSLLEPEEEAGPCLSGDLSLRDSHF